MELEQAKAKARARLAWVADHPDYEGEGDKVVKSLLAGVERLTTESATWKNYAEQEVDRLTADLAATAEHWRETAMFAKCKQHGAVRVRAFIALAKRHGIPDEEILAAMHVDGFGDESEAVRL